MILVVGAGGVGGYFGGMLWNAGEDVRFIARGAHLEAARSSGLRVRWTGGEFTVPGDRFAANPGAFGPAEAVLLCVKSYDTATAARMLAPALREETLVISLQNGIENEGVIAELIPRGRVLGGVAYIYATITEPGVVTETGGPKKLLFGPLADDPPLLARAEALAVRMRAAAVDARADPDIRTALWKKFVFIASVGGLTALTRLTLGEILAEAESRGLLERAMREAVAVARAGGVTIEPEYVEGVFDALRRYDNATRSSLYHDLVHGKPLEIEFLSGAVARLGRESGIDVPVHSTIAAALIPHHRRALRARAR